MVKSRKYNSCYVALLSSTWIINMFVEGILQIMTPHWIRHSFFPHFIEILVTCNYINLRYTSSSVVKESACNAGDARDAVCSLGREDPQEDGMATHSRILAWNIPWIEEPCGLHSISSQRIVQDWSNWACMHAHTYNMMTLCVYYKMIITVSLVNIHYLI